MSFCTPYYDDHSIDLECFTTKIENEYKSIEYKFGATSCVSPNKLEEYNKQHLYSKLYRNEKQRKSIQVKNSTLNPITVQNFIDQRGRFINQSKSKVYDQIKGKNYIIQLGNIPSTSKSRHPTFSVVESQTTCRTTFKFKTERFSTPQTSRPTTCSEIYKICQNINQDQKKLKKMMRQLKAWNSKQYENNMKRPQSCIQYQDRERKNQRFLTQFTHNIIKI